VERVPEASRARPPAWIRVIDDRGYHAEANAVNAYSIARALPNSIELGRPARVARMLMTGPAAIRALQA
jgi:hypothetical protein